MVARRDTRYVAHKPLAELALIILPHRVKFAGQVER